MTSASKNKGNIWEREISAHLSIHLGGSFVRVANSGAYIGGRNVHRKDRLSETQVTASKGDVVPPDHLLKMNIEAKNYENIAFHQILNGCCTQLDGWIDQTEIVESPGDISLTIFKITRKGSWIVFKESLKSNFVLDSYVHYKNTKNTYIITDFKSFVEKNAQALIRICAT